MESYPTLKKSPPTATGPETAVSENGTASGYSTHTPTANDAARSFYDTVSTPMDTRPTIAVFCYDGVESPLGADVLQLANALAQRGIACHLFTRSPYPAADGVTVHAVGGAGTDYSPESIEAYTRRVCSAYLHQFPTGTTPVPMVACEWPTLQAVTALKTHSGGKVIYSLHSLERERSGNAGPLSKEIEEVEHTGLQMADTILFYQQSTGDILNREWPDRAHRHVKANDPFPAHRFRRPIDRDVVKGRHQVGPVDPMILYVGDLDERHGPDILMRSVPAILRNHTQAHFVFVGDGPELWPLRVYARYLSLEHRVRFAGSLEGQRADELFQAADVVVVPSREATIWWPFQAAWAAGRPVVATHGLADGVLEHERNCVLVYPHESSCVWGIERILYDAGLRDNLTRRGTEKLEEQFGWKLLAAQVEELLGIKQNA